MSSGTVCITGASSGIGAAYARALALEGGRRFILAGRREEPLRALAAEIAGESDVGEIVTIITGDLSDPGECARLAAILRAREDLTMLIHNAGFGQKEPFLGATAQELRDMGEVHMLCTVTLLNAVIPLLQACTSTSRRPTVILVASMAAFLPMPGPAMYTATKAFMVFLARALHPELAVSGVRIQVNCPGFTHTGFHDRLDWNWNRRRNRGVVRWMTAPDVARRSLRAADRRRLWADPVFVPGFTNKVLMLLVSIIPRRLFIRLTHSFKF